MKLVNKVGHRYGRLLVQEHSGYYVDPRSQRRQSLWLCQCDCGNSYVVRGADLLNGHTKSCGCLRKETSRENGIKSGIGLQGPIHPNWKGGRVLLKSGYVTLYIPSHPSSQNGYVLEHRVVMEQKLKRLLYPSETVHHKNGRRSDNSDENLELWASKHPSGQRVSDLVNWAKEILVRYDNHTVTTTQE